MIKVALKCDVKSRQVAEAGGNESSAGEAEPALLALAAAAAVALITVLGWLQPAVHSST